jgi:hypothetical protein
MKFVPSLCMFLILLSCASEQNSELQTSPSFSIPAYGRFISPQHLNTPPIFLIDSTWLIHDDIKEGQPFFYTVGHLLHYANKRITFLESQLPYLSKLDLWDVWSSKATVSYLYFMTFRGMHFFANEDENSSFPKFLVFRTIEKRPSDKLSYFYVKSQYPGGNIVGSFEYNKETGFSASFTISWKDFYYVELTSFDQKDSLVLLSILSHIKPVLNDPNCVTDINDGLRSEEYFVYENELYHLDYLGCKCFWGEVILTYLYYHPNAIRGNAKEKSDEIRKRIWKEFPDLPIATRPGYYDWVDLFNVN